MERPKFENIKTYDEFIKYYWYRNELQAILKQLNLEFDGNKKELLNIIKCYFNGIKIPHKLKKKTNFNSVEKLTINTSLIKSSFCFNQKFRDFYITLTQDKNFKFTADMVATAKAVKENNDLNFTLGDLLDIKLGKKVYAKFDNSSCQWNKFLKDFCADEINNKYVNKLKAASQFWKILRDSDLPKVYTKEFVKNFENSIELC